MHWSAFLSQKGPLSYQQIKCSLCSFKKYYPLLRRISVYINCYPLFLADYPYINCCPLLHRTIRISTCTLIFNLLALYSILQPTNRIQVISLLQRSLSGLTVYQLLSALKYWRSQIFAKETPSERGTSSFAAD